MRVTVEDEHTAGRAIELQLQLDGQMLSERS